jgi:hypothetical protein
MTTTTADAGRRYPIAYAWLGVLAIALILFGIVGTLFLPYRIAGLGVPLGLTLWWFVGRLAEIHDKARGR